MGAHSGDGAHAAVFEPLCAPSDHDLQIDGKDLSPVGAMTFVRSVSQICRAEDLPRLNPRIKLPASTLRPVGQGW